MSKHNCIYCGEQIEPGGEGDHVIPDALGEFSGQHHFYEICRGCNQQVSVCEEQLFRCSDIAAVRMMVGQPQSSRKRGGTAKSSHGTKPPEFWLASEVGRLRVRPQGSGNTVSIQEQLIAVTKDNEEVSITLDPKMNLPWLKKSLLMQASIASIKRTRLIAEETNAGHYEELLNQIMPIADSGQTMEFVTGDARLKVSIRCECPTSAYLRALAKIVFHYYLVHDTFKRGDADEFFDIRSFIMNGGDHSDIYSNDPTWINKPQPTPNGLVLVPAKWHHQIVVYESQVGVIGGIVLYFGPQNIPDSHWFKLGKFKSSIATAERAWGSTYVFDPTASEKGAVHDSRPQKPPSLAWKWLRGAPT